MTEQDQRIAIAEACGWKSVRVCHNTKDFEMIVGCTPPGSFPCGLWEVPDYVHDLNAMAQAVATLGDGAWEDYFQQLIIVCCHPAEEGWDYRKTTDATSAQRAEAFLKCKGLWKE